jgi:hypothetical protein
MQCIFVSFRKIDDRVTRERLYVRLVAEFGAEQIFKSGESIPPGTDYVRILKTQAVACPVMLVLIGDGWLGAQDSTGARMIDREHEWVRLEIRTALESGNRVIPILLGDGTLLPTAQQLPADIASMADLQALRIPHSAVDSGLDQLLTVLGIMLPRLAPAPAQEQTSTRPAPAPSVGITAGKVLGPVIGGDAHGPVIGRDAHGPIVGGDYHETKVKKTGGGAPAGLTAVVMAAGRQFTKTAAWAGSHRLTAGISAVVVIAGVGAGVVVSAGNGAKPATAHGAAAAVSRPTAGPSLAIPDASGAVLKLTVYSATETANGDPQFPVKPVPGYDYVLVYGKLQNISDVTSDPEPVSWGVTAVNVQIPAAGLMAAAGVDADYGSYPSTPPCGAIAEAQPIARQFSAENLGYEPGDYEGEFGGNGSECAVTLGYGQAPNGPAAQGPMAPGTSVTGYFVSVVPIPTSISEKEIVLLVAAEPNFPLQTISLPW